VLQSVFTVIWSDCDETGVTCWALAAKLSPTVDPKTEAATAKAVAFFRKEEGR
jgi:hypothetical protein